MASGFAANLDLVRSSHVHMALPARFSTRKLKMRLSQTSDPEQMAWSNAVTTRLVNHTNLPADSDCE